MTRRAWRLPAAVRRLAAVVGLALGAAGPALAGAPAAGEEAPEAAGGRWLFEPAEDEYDVLALRGDVVVVLAWDAEDRPVLPVFARLLAAARELPGLHVRCFVPVGRGDSIGDRLVKAGVVGLPIAEGPAPPWRGDAPSWSWVVGVDGRVRWEGPTGDERLLKEAREEAARVANPGLGLTGLDKALDPALARFRRRDLDGARREARRVAGDAKATDAARRDAAALVERLARLGERACARAERLEAGGQKVDALERWEAVAAAWAKEPEGARAAARVEVLAADPEVKRERAAAKLWRALRPQLAGRDPEDQRAALERLLADPRLPGTRAAVEAREALVALPPPEPTAPPGGRGKR